MIKERFKQETALLTDKLKDDTGTPWQLHLHLVLSIGSTSLLHSLHHLPSTCSKSLVL